MAVAEDLKHSAVSTSMLVLHVYIYIYLRLLALSAGTPSIRMPKSSPSSLLLFRLLNDRSIAVLAVVQNVAADAINTLADANADLGRRRGASVIKRRTTSLSTDAGFHPLILFLIKHGNMETRKYASQRRRTTRVSYISTEGWMSRASTGVKE
jgi:hypothetical protein